MNDKSTVLRGFNNTFFEFVEDVISIFPDNMDLKTTKSAFEMFKKANPTSIIKAWHYFVYTPYKDVIMNGDISPFFDKDYSGDLTYMSNAVEILNAIDRIRGPIKSMEENNKMTATVYIQNLCKLSNIYNTLVTEG
jgi:hypothetical protein|uniref:Uncharacterized protein n=1 Tax=viral metagenome TaxID=1070528 RepID=A0A6C0E1W4_9ZZZZ